MTARRKASQPDEDRARDFAALDRIGEAFSDVLLDELEREIARVSDETRREMQRRPNKPRRELAT